VRVSGSFREKTPLDPPGRACYIPAPQSPLLSAHPSSAPRQRGRFSVAFRMESVVRNSASTISLRRLIPCLFAALAAAMFWPATASAKIEADRTKIYKLTDKHGPWMISVTSLWGETPDQKERAEKAANELVYQLRRKGIPAYIYTQADEYEESDGYDRLGRKTKRKYKAKNGMIGVVAGNYESLEDKVAQQTLRFVKRFEPKVKVDGDGKKPSDVTLALNKAFLTRNPMLPPDQLARKSRDPLLLKLNTGHQNSLYENKGRFSLIVASFYGNSQIKPAQFQKFDQKQQANKNISLENAARESELLCAAMRKQGHDAYIYHDRFRSVVTVGSFKSKDDPEINRLYKMYQAKYKKHEQTGQEVLVAEAIKFPSANGNDAPMAWTMDPVPELMEVPK
jgi:hypothetical protein